MDPDWQAYLCRVNGELASIALDLNLRTVAPESQRTHLLRVWLYLKNPRPDGLSSRDEGPVLWKIEDALIEAVGQNLNAVLAGRITTQGRREFYFYCAATEDAPSLIRAAIAPFAYKYWSESKSDPQWDQYLSVLYPGEEDLQKMLNRKVLDNLDKHGDEHDRPREVQH